MSWNLDQLVRHSTVHADAYRNLLADTVSKPFNVNWMSLQLHILEDPPADFDASKRADLLQKMRAELRDAKAECEGFKRRYDAGNAEAVCGFISSVFGFDRMYLSVDGIRVSTGNSVSLLPNTGVLVVDSELPQIGSLPMLADVKQARSTGKSKLVKLSAKEIEALYDNLLYQICLREIGIAFAADTRRVIQSVVFNGWASSVDPKTGHDNRACIMTVHAERDAFLSLNLARVDPTACFKSLKGISGVALHQLTPVAPLMRLNRNDPRFVESVEVASKLREGTNLAAIGWEDFEQLIRQLFEMEFSRDGGEVKVTQASRDGGVDAVAFDPDPIRGGKIVIQAKRYTNTVEVSAVRDLWGTVQHEGAMKGILVTTSNFGPDSYSFAKDKPITLLDGSNLLHMLEQHGHRAYIDLAEAKKLNPTPLARTLAD